MGTSTIATEILATTFVHNGDAMGDWIEWRVDDSVVHYVPAEQYDLVMCITCSFGDEHDEAAIEAARAKTDTIAGIMTRPHLWKPGKRERGTEWTTPYEAPSFGEAWGGP